MELKIPLFKAKSLGFERDMVSFSIKYGNLPEALFKGIVDTGCPYTILSESSLRRTRIPYNSKETQNTVNIGGILMELKKLGICKLSFRDINNIIHSIQQEVYVGVPITKGYLSQEIPSFLGKDFLDNHMFSIINRKDGSMLTKEI